MKRVINKFNKTFGDLLNLLNINPKLECPFCGGRFRTFLPHIDIPAAREKNIVGMGYRGHCYCPKCHSKDRERLVFLFLKNEIDSSSKKINLLHVAPENKIKEYLVGKENINYITADLNMGSVMVKMDIRYINHPAESFHVIVCNHVLQYIEEDLQAIHELYRVLKPGGWAILQVPISLSIGKALENVKLQTHEEEEEEIFGDRGVVRLYGKIIKIDLNRLDFMSKNLIGRIIKKNMGVLIINMV